MCYLSTLQAYMCLDPNWRQHEPEVFSCVDSWQVWTLSGYLNSGGAILPSLLPVIFLVSCSSIYTLVRSLSLPGNSRGVWQLGIHSWVLTSCRSVATLCRCVPIPYKMQCRYQKKTEYPTYKGIIVFAFHCLFCLQGPALQVRVDEIHGSLPYGCLQWLAWSILMMQMNDIIVLM